MSQLLMLMLLGASLLLAGCEKKEAFPPPKTNAEDVQQAPVVNVEAATEQARKEFVSKARKDLDVLNTKLAEFRNKTKVLTGEAKAQVEKQIKNLEQEQSIAEQKLAELQTATAGKWSELKQGVSEGIDRFKQALEKANGHDS